MCGTTVIPEIEERMKRGRLDSMKNWRSFGHSWAGKLRFTADSWI